MCALTAAGRGFALVEALVATLIVSVGLLGVAQLALTSLRESAEALTRTQAVALVGDIAERIRANPDARDAYDCASYGRAPTQQGCAPSGLPARSCTPRELAEDDLARWQAQALQNLRLADLGVCAANVSFVSGSPSRYLIEVSWLQRGDPQPVTLCSELQLADGAPI